MSDLSDARRERDRLERHIDALHRRHDAATREARHHANDLTKAEGDLNEVLLRINRLKP
jgi:hypothetical protein